MSKYYQLWIPSSLLASEHGDLWHWVKVEGRLCWSFASCIKGAGKFIYTPPELFQPLGSPKNSRLSDLIYGTSCPLAFHTKLSPFSGPNTRVLSERACEVCRRHQPSLTVGIPPHHRVFMYHVHAKCSSYKNCCRKSRLIFPNTPISHTKPIYNYAKRFLATRSVPDSKRTGRTHVSTEGELDEIDDWLETSPRKEMVHLIQQTGVSVTSARKATKPLNLHPGRQFWFIRHIWNCTINFLLMGMLKD